MMYETLKLETDARGVATLTLAREEKHNAMSAQMIAELTGAAAALAADDAVRVVVLTGAGNVREVVLFPRDRSRVTP